MNTVADLELAHAAAISLADEAHAKKIEEIDKTFPRVDCTRCGGKGYAHFLGPQNAPGACYRCGGEGKVVARNYVKRSKLLRLQVDLDRLRVYWQAAKSCQKALQALPPSRDARFALRSIEECLRIYEQNGKAVAALVNAEKNS